MLWHLPSIFNPTWLTPVLNPLHELQRAKRTSSGRDISSTTPCDSNSVHSSPTYPFVYSWLRPVLFPLVFIIIATLCPLPVSAVNVFMGPGDTVTRPKIVSSRFVDYNIVGDSFNGFLELNIQLVRAPYEGPILGGVTANLPSSGSDIEITQCWGNKENPNGIGNCQPRVKFTNARCTSADKGNYNTCMSRIAGTTETFRLPVSERVDILAGSLFCIRSYMYFVGAVTAATSFSLYNVPFIVCQGEPGAPVTPPGVTGSACSLDSQSLSLSYTSPSLAVGGLRQSMSFAVRCSSGTPQNYNLRLTGTNVSNGRLNFGNGVSAEVILDNEILSANGAAIRYDALTSRTMMLSAVLHGTASTPGVSNASGVLILDAL